jgi:hypothetical protein
LPYFPYKKDIQRKSAYNLQNHDHRYMQDLALNWQGAHISKSTMNNIYFLYPDVHWVINSARASVTYMYHIGPLFINILMILSALRALPQCPHYQCVSGYKYSRHIMEEISHFSSNLNVNQKYENLKSITWTD